MVVGKCLKVTELVGLYERLVKKKEKLWKALSVLEYEDEAAIPKWSNIKKIILI